MLKLLYIPTGNIFTLPDEEAFRIKKEDRGDNYKIFTEDSKELDIETKEENKKPTIKELVMPDEPKEQEVELPPAKQEELEEPQEKERVTIEELQKMDRFALYGLAQRLDLKPKSNANKATLLKMLKETGAFS